MVLCPTWLCLTIQACSSVQAGQLLAVYKEAAEQTQSMQLSCHGQAAPGDNIYSAGAGCCRHMQTLHMSQSHYRSAISLWHTRHSTGLTTALKFSSPAIGLHISRPVHSHKGGCCGEDDDGKQEEQGGWGGCLLAKFPEEAGIAGEQDAQLQQDEEVQEDYCADLQTWLSDSICDLGMSVELCRAQEHVQAIDARPG